ncbi:MAG: hypothetical protein EPN30_00195 [Actinomycetota bacterium]|nr:MAG: hypothetical protein EPN30_00195 [Actinomycetota bacterium]
MRLLQLISRVWRPEERYFRRTRQTVAIPGRHSPPKSSKAILVTRDSNPDDFQSEPQLSRRQPSSPVYLRKTVNEILENHRTEIQSLVNKLLAEKQPLIIHHERGEVRMLYRRFWNRTGILDVQWVTTSGLHRQVRTVLRGRKSDMPDLVAWHLARYASHPDRGWGILEP